MYVVCNCPSVHDYFGKPNQEIIDRFFLLKMDKDLSFGTVLKFDGKYYGLCSKDAGNNLIIVRECEYPDGKKEFYAESNIKCPVCGEENNDSWECSDNDDTEECSNCGSKFSWERNVEVTYSMELIKKNKPMEV